DRAQVSDRRRLPRRERRAFREESKTLALPVWQRERVYRVARCDGDVLLAVDRVTNRRGGHVRAGREMPEVRTGLRVERDEIAVADRAEDDVSPCGEHAVGARALLDLEVPDRFP